MKRFARLFAALDQTNKTNRKIAALEDYFRAAPAADAAWAVFLLSGRKVRQVVPIRKLCGWACEYSGTPDWLFEECYEAVGDLAETVTLLMPPPANSSDDSLSVWMEQHLTPLRNAPEPEQRDALYAFWDRLDEPQRFLLHKLITGAFRVGVSKRLVTRAVANVTGLSIETVTHRMMGDWSPSAAFYEGLAAAETGDADRSQPYPFFLAQPLESSPSDLGESDGWAVEWKWDGIRAQLIRREGETFIWSRGEELISEQFPELLEGAKQLPDGVVLDGEILAWKDGVLPFAMMQKRIGRKKLGKKILADAPVVLMAFDILEQDGEDIRERPLINRRKRLEQLLAPLLNDASPFRLSERIAAASWDEFAALRQTSRERRTEGLMLKRNDSPYRSGRPRGDWWKWKIEPHTVDAVLIYAQRGSGRRASLYTDYTFAVWHEEQLVPFAKAYSGLTDEEIAEVDAFVRKNTVERFGPVRSVTPELVFEIAFENIQASKRHKSGVAVRFPRIARWRRDLAIEDADQLATIKALAESQ